MNREECGNWLLGGGGVWIIVKCVIQWRGKTGSVVLYQVKHTQNKFYIKKEVERWRKPRCFWRSTLRICVGMQCDNLD